VIAGSANNQLRTAHDADLLAERDILFAPDFVLNAGGVMGASHDGALPENADGDAVRKLEEADAVKIGDVVRRAFSRSSSEHVTPYEAAVRMAKEKIEERRSA
jgi:leucine dehydrogenase